MQQYVIELSKYGITVCMFLFTVGSFVGLWDKFGNRRGFYVWQCCLLFLVQLFCFLDLTLVSGDMEYVFFYVFVQVFLLTAAVMVPIIYEDVNRMLLGGMCMLLGTGMCMVSRLSFNLAVRQYIIVLISLIFSLLIPYLFSRIRFLKKLTWVYGLLGVGMLSAVLLMSETTYGSKISFTIGSITFQPSEFVKILFVFYLAGTLWEKSNFGRVALSAVVAGLHVIVLMLSRDLGSALIFFVGYVFIVFVATGNYLYLLLGAIGGSAASYVAYQLFAHVRERVLAWRDPWTYIDDQSYAITQSLFAISSGSWFGMGLLQGDPDHIPMVMEDFIFSSVCEELGVIYGCCIILLSVSLFLLIMKIATEIHDRFYQLIVYGIGVMYAFQIFLTAGGGTKLIPLTGVTLPFLSYGGSSVMTSMLMFFIIQGIYVRLKQEGGKRVGRKSGKGKTSAGRPGAGKPDAGRAGGRKAAVREASVGYGRQTKE